MRRRDVLAVLVFVLTATRSFAQAKAGPPVVAFLGFASAAADRETLNALKRGLREQGYVEGQTILIEARHTDGDLDTAARILDELVRRPVNVFVAPGPAAARFIHRATQIPVVALGLPPTDNGSLFATVARPSGSVAGFTYFGETLSA